jgi:predicted O-linked N-acetylglucosamine transferase (SPINDLY family)
MPTISEALAIAIGRHQGGELKAAEQIYLDSAWMGAPIVTLVGATVVGRAGLSQLTNLAWPELIAHTPEQYVAIAATLAQELPPLSRLRATLRDCMQASPLMNAPRFARIIEAAYRTMWRRSCDS